MYSKIETKSLVEAGLLVAITVVLSFFVAFVPVLGAIGYFTLPVPIAILYIRHDFKLSFIASIVSAIVIGATLGFQSALNFFILFPIIGLILGYSFKRKLKVSRSLILTSLAGLVTYIISVIYSLLFIDKVSISNITEYIKTTFNESLDAYISMLGNQSAGKEIDILREWINNVSLLSILSLVTIGAIMFSIMQSFIYYFITRSILKKLKIEVVEIGDFDKVYVDNRIGALLIIILSIGRILQIKNYDIGTYIYNVAIYILMGVLIVVGSAVIYYFLKSKFNINKGVAITIILVILFTQLSIFIVYIGLADLIFDFRKVDPNRLFKGRRFKG
ncbi:MAG: DUF2232 domain-containing protein [Clostridiales bacterium]|uniref:DUF2232 domain-containing protein n=1 Tax=Clostridium sp. N3C TaxID=1776758 RepID=UPI00092E1809|nr:DUF2232 domain-containing protein [Clostridium sp. N3C]NLZ48703.1 DUF2232 domain-containing protein [Clostridiales bacterium]SCN25568.1 putative membrane protein [Clostridium sp. N3C]